MRWDEEAWNTGIRIVRDVILIGAGVVLIVTEVILRPAGRSPDPLVLGLITLLLGYPVGALADRLTGRGR